MGTLVSAAGLLRGNFALLCAAIDERPERSVLPSRPSGFVIVCDLLALALALAGGRRAGVFFC